MNEGRKKERKMEGCQKRKKEIEGREERKEREKETFKFYYIRQVEREINRVRIQKEKTCLNVKVVM